ncbi:hypothetical protein SPD48_09675 [Pseudogracilibacillus sp. SE30717A]|uniref:hypothetical protein n=1 Tax=Pseudogracilibacillus sp. SE30717A TaxID=3098293 RepID=UPI00300DEDFA
MSKRVISSDELIAMSNEDVATELFFIIVQHGQKNLKDVFHITREIEKHAKEIEKRIQLRKEEAEQK